MRILTQLTASQPADLLGLFQEKTPLWLWVWLAGILAVAIIFGCYGWWKAWQLRKVVRGAATALAAMPPITDDGRRFGRPLGDIDIWRKAYRDQTGEARRIADEVERGVVALTDAEGERRFKLQEDHETIWDRSGFVERFVNLDLLASVPGVLTALGLIGTFIAIALGLLVLSPGEGGVINGVNGLLEGLGGKFTSSIGALGLALVFQLLDTTLFRRSFAISHTLLVDAVHSAFPRLSPTQQVSDLLESQRRQEAALANISSDVVTHFGEMFASSLLPDLSRALGQSVQSEMGPVLKSVATGITNLEEAIKNLERGKQESIGEELRVLTRNLEDSLKAALVEMGDSFRTALAGSADGEFKQAAEAMRGAGEMLRGMNGAFDSMQTALARLMTDAEDRASRSFAEGEGRTRALNDLVENLVLQLQESASSNIQQSSQVLADAMAGMSQRVAAMSAEIEQRAREGAELSMKSNQAAVKQLSDAAGRTTAETERLLATLGSRSDDFVAAADQLRELRSGVERVLLESGARVRDLQEAAVAFRSVATEASTLTRELRGTSELQRKAIEGTTTMVASVSDVVREQALVADRTRDSFAVAGKMLGSLDTDLARALQAVVEGMQQYNVQVERNFESIIGKVNKEMPALFERLEQSLAQVSSAVEDLNDMLARQQGRQT
jgi:hypothetical protein